MGKTKIKTLAIIVELDDGSIRQVIASDDTNDWIINLIVQQEGKLMVSGKKLEGLYIETL